MTDDRRRPAVMQYLDMQWGRMGYACVSKPGATPFVFLHGTGCDVSDWNGVTAALCAGGPLVRVDFRGHGASDVPGDSFGLSDLADDVILLVNELGLQDVVLVGHSLGGMAALAIASRAPWVKALVLLEGWTCLRAAAAFAGERFYGRLPPQAVAQIQEKSAATRARFAAAVWDNFWASVQAFDAAPILARIAVPVFEVYGGMGKTGATRGILAVPDRSSIEICWIADAGHYLPQERPVDVAAICMRAGPLHVPASLVKNFRVDYRDASGQWHKLAQAENNYRRLVRMPVAATAQAVRFVPEATWGSEAVRVFAWEIA